MYCRTCGQPIDAGASFCPHCGAAQRGRPGGGAPSWLVILLLILFFPVGLALMWTRTQWEQDVKWAVTGIFFPPVWAYFIWKQRWELWARVALSLLLVAAAVLGLNAIAGPTAAEYTLPLDLVLAYLGGRAGERDRLGRRSGDSLRNLIASRLEACHDLIAEIESGQVLDLLPITAPARQRYIRALEMRAEGLELFQRATAEPELVTADARVSRALEELSAARDDLIAESSRLPSEPPTP